MALWPNLPDLHAMTNYQPPVPLRVYTADKILIGEFGKERREILRFCDFPNTIKVAILSAEDDRFYQHRGIDWVGIVRASLANLVNMSRLQGASTITMQLARNFYLSSNKTYSRKLYELLLTFKIESQIDKNQILEIYMNQIYLGNRTYGFAAAAQTYLGKSISEVTIAEAALLASIPKAPSRFNPVANRSRANLRQCYVLSRMLDTGYLTQVEYRMALSQLVVVKTANSVTIGSYDIHGEYIAELTRQLLYNIYEEEVYSRGISVYTTIRARDQETAYRAVREGVFKYTRRVPYLGPESQLNIPLDVEKDLYALDKFLGRVLGQPTENDDFFPALVLETNSEEIKIIYRTREATNRSFFKTRTIDKKALGSISYFSEHESGQKSIRRGSVICLHRLDSGWEVINMPSVQAAFVSMLSRNGAIRSLVGGFDFHRGNFNRVIQAWRQPGSAIKPFIYAASLERGLTPATKISDQLFRLATGKIGSRSWTPRNYGNRYESVLTMRQGLYKSKNMVSIRILQAIGPEYTQAYLTKFGFDKARQPAILPLALGAGSVTPLQLTNAYAVFANGGHYIAPYFIDRILDKEGNILMQARPISAGTKSTQTIDSRTAYVMNDMLRGVTTSGTASRVSRILRRNDVAGKTGTTNESVDGWFSGYTPSLVATAWLGFDHPKSLGIWETGGGAAMPIWLSYMQEILNGSPEEKEFVYPDGLLSANGDFYFIEFPPGQAITHLESSIQSKLLDTS